MIPHLIVLHGTDVGLLFEDYAQAFLYEAEDVAPVVIVFEEPGTVYEDDIR